MPALQGKRNNVSLDLSRHQNLNFRIISSVNSITILEKKKKLDDFYLFILVAEIFKVEPKRGR